MYSSGSIQPGENWEKLLEKFAGTGGILISIGAPDTGKSTFNLWLCNQLFRMGKITAIVDCDMGQSDVGPPSALGMAVVRNELTGYRDLNTDGIWFVGSTKPSGHFLQGLSGAVKLTAKAVRMGASHIVVNTTGWIDGPGIFYKQNKIDALNPSCIAAFQHDRELMPVVSAYKRYDNLSTVFIKPSSAVTARNSDERRRYRQSKFKQYFSDVSIVALSLNKTGISGYGFYPDEKKIVNQVVALIDSKGEHKAIGIIKQFNPKTRTIEIEAKLTDNSSVIRRIHFENYKISEEGDDYTGQSQNMCG